MKTSIATTTHSTPAAAAAARFGGVRGRRLGGGRGREGTGPGGAARRRNVVRVQGFLGLGSGRETTTTTTTKDLFAGAKRAEVRIPGFCAIVDVRDVLENPDAVDRVLHAGATVVALQDSSPGETSGKTLYEAAAKLKTLVRGRACVLIGDRTDIALSAELDGVVLTDEGVPTVVARKSLPETAVVAVSSETAEDGETASKEGADLLLVRNEEVLEAIREKVSVPIFVDAAEGLDSLLSVTSLAAKGANGVTLRSLPAASESEEMIAEAVQRVTKGLKQNNRDQDSTVSNGSTSTNGVATTEPKKFSLVSADGEEMIDRERELIEELLAFLNENCSDLEEIKLLTEARKGLEELFLVVIVGEFNAGKSSVINAMLGDKFVAEGILPTTNEISVLRYGKKKSREQTEDGFFNVDVPADLLQQVRIVDTPGTNVILQRQQRLTEEFVPRADLVLFVLSADRPMTESEVKFLTYIRKWGKKVVFVVNKTDLLSEPSDVQEVMTFVKDNAERLLGVTNPAVLPVSSRNALKAKKSAGAAYGKSEAFIQSGFGKFEDYVMSFLGGTGERAGEALRLKLSTPLNVGELLLNAAEQILDEEDDQAKSEVAIATGVKTQMDNYKAEMIADAATQRAAARDVVASAVKRAEVIVDSSLRLSNAASLFSTYILGSGPGDIVKEYKTNVLGDSERQLKSAVAEFSAWLRRNNDAQLKAYSEAVESRGFDTSIAKLSAEWSDEQTMDEEGNIIETSSKASLNVASGFDHDAAAQLLDDAVRSAVNSTIGSAGGAFLVAFIATGYLNSFSEDVLVYALALAGAYISVLSLPLKRSEIKAKIRRTADTFLDELEQAMEKECTREVSEVGESVSTMCAPWEASARAEAARVAECIDARRRLKSSLDELLRDVANL